MKVLLVDDSKDVLEELNKTFELIKGLKIVGKAQTEPEALAMFHRENPDVVCLDIRLQQGSGLNILKEIRKVNATTGYTPNDLLRNIRLKKAAALFTAGHENVAQVMYQVGFNHQSYFAKCFRELFHVNPSDYIKNNSGK